MKKWPIRDVLIVLLRLMASPAAISRFFNSLELNEEERLEALWRLRLILMLLTIIPALLWVMILLMIEIFGWPSYSLKGSIDGSLVILMLIIVLVFIKSEGQYNEIVERRKMREEEAKKKRKERKKLLGLLVAREHVVFWENITRDIRTIF
jgi:hypothetical protein